MWKIKAPPKVLNMVWRALAQCLPTLTALHGKHVPVSKMCPVCNGEEESTLHALVKCPFAAQCWGDKGLLWVGSSFGSFAEWLDEVLRLSRKDEYAEIVTLCWSIWKARNNTVWNKVRASVYGVVNSTKQYLADWSKAQKNSTKTLFQFLEEGDGVCNWVKPQKEVVKISVDAAIFTEHSSYGVGMLARDWEGKVILGRSEYYSGYANPEFAEAMAVKEALSWVKANKWEKVVVESDCLTVVQAARSKVPMLSPFGKVILECRNMISDSNIVLLFVRRSANMAAHFLARESRSFPGRVFDRGSVPVKLHPILLDDLME